MRDYTENTRSAEVHLLSVSSNTINLVTVFKWQGEAVCSLALYAPSRAVLMNKTVSEPAALHI